MKKIYTLFLFAIVFTCLQAQPTEVITATSHRYDLDNPAAVGLDGRHHIFAGANKKWFGLEGSPQTFFASSSHPFINEAFGIGGTIVQDRAGLIKNTRLSLQSAIHFNPKSDHVLSFGVSGRLHLLGFDGPNVSDQLTMETSAAHINLGAGVNLHSKLGGEGSFFNFHLMLSQFPSSVELETGDPALDYAAPNHLVAQANLRYPLRSLTLTPSLRYQAQVSDGNTSKTQIIDLGLGVAFADERFRVRVGARSGDVNIVYGGVGIQFGQSINAYIFAEPGSKLGTSGTFDAEYVFGDPDPNPDPLWKDIAYLTGRLEEKGLSDDFEVMIFSDPVLGQTLILYSFNDWFDPYFDYFEHPDFLEDKPVDDLVGELREICKLVTKDKKEIAQFNLIGKARNPLDQETFEVINVDNFRINYISEGERENALLNAGDALNEGQLTGLKLNNLARKYKDKIEYLEGLRPKVEVVRDEGMRENRVIQVGITVNEY